MNATPSSSPTVGCRLMTGRSSIRTVVLVVAVVFFTLSACKPVAKEQPPTPPPPTTVTVATVVTGPVAASFEVVGSVRPFKEARIQSDVAGRVVKAFLKEGDAVKAGQVLFFLERAPSRDAGVQSGAAAVAKRATKKRAEIRSPIAGVLISKLAKPGDLVTTEPPKLLAVVADIDLMRMIAPLPDERRAEVRDSQEVTVTTDILPGKGFGGRVSQVVPGAGATSTSTQVEILVNNQDLALKPAMPLRGRVFTAYRPLTILVPPQALIDGRVVVVEGDRVRSRLVQTGIRTEEAVEALSGVVPGELVVTSGHKHLSDGVQVSYQKQ